jgi:hypothetical protein
MSPPRSPPTLWALPARAEEFQATVPNLRLLDDGSGDGAPGGWTNIWTPEGRTIGLGLQVGFPSAITLEAVLSERNSVVVGLGAFGYRFFSPALSIYADYLWHPGILAHPGGSLVLSWYVGVGGWLTFYENGYAYSGYAYGGDSNVAVALRVPLGLDLSLGPVPLMFYVELVPALLVFPNIDVGLGASLGARFFF